MKMKMTSKRAMATITRYHQLKDMAGTFMQEKKNGHYWRDVRIDEWGNIEEWVNTACHCHPEYSWEPAATAQEFGAWLDKRAAESTP